MSHHHFLDRCIFMAASAGTGDFAVSIAVQGYQTPTAAGAHDGYIMRYSAQTPDLSQWEYGTGTWVASGATLVRTTVLGNSLGTTAKINFSTAPQVMISVLAEDMEEFMEIAESSLTWYVSPTGDDLNPGSSALPFQTIQHAVNVATNFNYQGLYSTTIRLADGTYASSLSINIPSLTNSSSLASLIGSTVASSNVVIQKTTSGDLINILGAGPSDGWSLTGFECDCNHQAINNYNSYVRLGDLRFKDTLSAGVAMTPIGTFNGGFTSGADKITIVSSNIYRFMYGELSYTEYLCTNVTYPSGGCAVQFVFLELANNAGMAFRQIATNSSLVTGAQVLFSAKTILLSQTGTFEDIPGTTGISGYDGTSWWSAFNNNFYTNTGLNRFSGTPTSSVIPAGFWSVYKDTSASSGVWVIANDGGTIKSVALSS